MIFLKAKGKLGIVLTIIAGAGFLYTIYLTAKKAPEAQKLKEEALEKKRQDTGDENAQLTTAETIQAQLPCYGPIVGTAAVTLGSIIGSQLLPQSYINDVKALHNAYKEVTAKVNGPEAEKMISALANQKVTQSTDGYPKEKFAFLFDDKFIEFEATLVDVLYAEYDVNKLFKNKGDVTFNQLLQIFKQKEVSRGDDFGWDEELGDVWYGYSWINFEHIPYNLNGHNVTLIRFRDDCHALCEDPDDPITE